MRQIQFSLYLLGTFDTARGNLTAMVVASSISKMVQVQCSVENFRMDFHAQIFAGKRCTRGAPILNWDASSVPHLRPGHPVASHIWRWKFGLGGIRRQPLKHRLVQCLFSYVCVCIFADLSLQHFIMPADRSSLECLSLNLILVFLRRLLSDLGFLSRNG